MNVITYEKLPSGIDRLRKVEEINFPAGDNLIIVDVMKGFLEGRKVKYYVLQGSVAEEGVEMHVWKDNFDYFSKVLPDELIYHIFSWLKPEPSPERVLLNIEQTCKKLNGLARAFNADYFNKDKISFEEFGLKSKDHAVNFAVTMGPHLKYADFSGFKLNKSDIEKLANACPNLEKLNLQKSNDLTDACIEKLPRSLTSLNLAGCDHLTDACIENLPRTLISLNLYFCRNLTGAGFDKLPNGLIKLNLWDCNTRRG